MMYKNYLQKSKISPALIGAAISYFLFVVVESNYLKQLYEGLIQDGWGLVGPLLVFLAALAISGFNQSAVETKIGVSLPLILLIVVFVISNSFVITCALYALPVAMVATFFWFFPGLKSPKIPKEKAPKGKQNDDQESRLHFKDHEAAFEYACKYMQTPLYKGGRLPAIITEIKHGDGNEDNGTAFVRVASSDGGFSGEAPLSGSDYRDLEEGDLVVWRAFYQGSTVNDNKQSRWFGFIEQKLDPILDVSRGWVVIETYRS